MKRNPQGEIQAGFIVCKYPDKIIEWQKKEIKRYEEKAP